jgi:hypothetical protein
LGAPIIDNEYMLPARCPENAGSTPGQARAANGGSKLPHSRCAAGESKVNG